MHLQLPRNLYTASLFDTFHDTCINRSYLHASNACDLLPLRRRCPRTHRAHAWTNPPFPPILSTHEQGRKGSSPLTRPNPILRKGAWARHAPALSPSPSSDVRVRHEGPHRGMGRVIPPLSPSPPFTPIRSYPSQLRSHLQTRARRSVWTNKPTLVDPHPLTPRAQRCMQEPECVDPHSRPHTPHPACTTSTASASTRANTSHGCQGNGVAKGTIYTRIAFSTDQK